VKLEPAIDFDSVDDQPVDLVLALLGPLGAGAEHLKALSRVARALRSEELVSALRASSEPAQLYGQLARAQAAHKAA
jgi:PTS system nitrogen regulatory IIA component